MSEQMKNNTVAFIFEGKLDVTAEVRRLSKCQDRRK